MQKASLMRVTLELRRARRHAHNFLYFSSCSHLTFDDKLAFTCSGYATPLLPGSLSGLSCHQFRAGVSNRPEWVGRESWVVGPRSSMYTRHVYILLTLNPSLLRSRYQGSHATLLPTNGCSRERHIPFPKIDQ